MDKAELLIKQADNNIEKPFVTAKFGYAWKEHTKVQFEKGEINLDMILDIAWKQGRRAILLEDALRKNL